MIFSSSWQVTLFIGSICLASTVILSVAWIATWLANKQSASFRYQFWHFSFLALGFLPLLILLVRPYPVPDWVSTIRSSRSTLESVSSVNRQPGSLEGMGSTVFHRPAGLSNLRKRKPKLLQESVNGPGENSAASPAPAAMRKIDTPNSIGEEEKESKGSASISIWSIVNWQSTEILFLVIWGAGLLYGIQRFAYSTLRLRRIIGQATSLHDLVEVEQKVIHVFESHRNEMNVVVKVSREVRSPMAVGVFSPTILLPSEASNWTFERIRMVMAHELEHIRRKDVFWNGIFYLVKSFFWIQPLAWIGWRQIQLLRELACDDQVLAENNQPATYAQQLLEISRGMNGSAFCPLGAITMAQKPIEKRVHSILDIAKNRTKPQFLSGFCVALAFLTLCIPLVVFRPLEASAQEQEKRTHRSAVNSQQTLPKNLTGNVVDYQEKPVEGAVVDLELRLSDDRGIYDWASKGISLKGVTDKNGQYSIATGHISSAGKGISITGYITSKNHPSARYGWSYKSIPKKFEAITTKFFRSRVITGRVIGSYQRDGKLVQPDRPWIRVACENRKDINNSWFSIPKTSDKDGAFRIVIPYGLAAEVICTDNEFTGKRIYLPALELEGNDRKDLGNIELTEGTRVFGSLVDVDGKAIAGAAVEIASLEKSQLYGIHLGNEFTTVTDQNGKFQFSPFSGKCIVRTVDSGRGKNRKRIRNKLEYRPLIEPVTLDLVAKNSFKEISLQTVPTVVLSGTVRWKDGSPVPFTEVWGSTNDGGTGMRVKTDKDGRYKLRLRKKAAIKNVSVLSTFGEKKHLHWPVLRASFPAPASHHGYSQLRNITEDTTGIDWVMVRSYTLQPGLDNSPSSQELDQMYQEFLSDQKMFNRILNSKKLEDKPSYIRQSDPFPMFIETLLDHEKKFRGKPGGLDALGQVLVIARQNPGDRQIKPFQEIASKRILDHYADNLRLLPLLNLLCSRQLNPNFSQLSLASQIIIKSKNDEIKAEAYFQLLQYMVTSTNHCNRFSDFPSISNVGVKQDEMVNVYAKKIKKLAGSKIRRVSGLRMGAPNGFGEGRWKGDLEFNPNPKSYDQFVDAVLNDYYKHQPGMMFPIIKGKDFHGKKQSTAMLNGKVIILIAEGVTWSPSQRDKARQIMESYGKEKLTTFLVSNSGNYNGFYNTKEKIEDGKIGGVVVNDSVTRENAYRLNNYGYPDHYYLIGADGKLLCRSHSMALLEEKVKEVLGPAQKN